MELGSLCGQQAQNRRVDHGCTNGEIRVLAGSEGKCLIADVRCCGAHSQAKVGERVLESEVESKRIARPWMHHDMHLNAIVAVCCAAPIQPARQAVNSVASRQLLNWQLLMLTVKFILAIRDAIRPWQPRLTPPS